MTPALLQTARGRESAPLTLPGPPPHLEVVKPEYMRSVLRARAGGAGVSACHGRLMTGPVTVALTAPRERVHLFLPLP